MSALPAAAAAAAEWRATAHQYWPPQDARIRSSLSRPSTSGGCIPHIRPLWGIRLQFCCHGPAFLFLVVSRALSGILCLCPLSSGVRCPVYGEAAQVCSANLPLRKRLSGCFVPPLTPQRGRFAQSHISLNQPDQPTRGKAEKQQTEVSQTQAYYLLELAFERSHGAWPAGRAHTRVEFQLSLRNLAS